MPDDTGQDQRTADERFADQLAGDYDRSRQKVAPLEGWLRGTPVETEADADDNTGLEK